RSSKPQKLSVPGWLTAVTCQGSGAPWPVALLALYYLTPTSTHMSIPPTSQRLDKERYGWLQVARGNATLNGLPLREGDGVAIAEGSELRLFSCASFGSWVEGKSIRIRDPLSGGEENPVLLRVLLGELRENLLPKVGELGSFALGIQQAGSLCLGMGF
ncbi:hypothetical protein ACVWW8_002684, partial [Thermostichus sp. MS-CIW-22]